MTRLLALTHSSVDPASRFRVLQYLPHLERAGFSVAHRPCRPPRPWRSPLGPGLLRALHERAAVLARRLSRLRDIRDATGFDVVLQNRDLLEGRVRYDRLLRAARVPVVFDFDDAIFLGRKKAAHVGWICRSAAWVTAGNEDLAAFAARHTDRVTVIPTVVEAARYRVADHAAPTRRVGWCGSDLSIKETLAPFVPVLARLQRRLGFDVVVVSRPRPLIPEEAGLRWSYVEWSERVEQDLAAHMDVGIMPLEDEPFQRGKCGCKLVQYMASGLPAVASPVGVNRRLVEHGRRGFLASSEAEWEAALTALLDGPARRREHGLAGRAHVERELSLERWAPVLAGILERVARRRRR